MTPAEKLSMIKAQRVMDRTEREVLKLDNPIYQDYVLNKDDAPMLDAILDNIAKAYNRPIGIGYTYNENVEKIVAIASKLQYADAKTRELINPDYYDIFDRTIRDMLLKGYGQLPYQRQVTTIETTRGTIELDRDLVERAKQGTKPNIALLSEALDIVATNLGLCGTYVVSETEARIAWDNSVSKLAKLDTLQSIKEEFEAEL